MSITSWPGPGVGGATSSSLRSSTGPHARQITALINPEEYTGEAPCGGRDTDADCGGSSSRQRRSTTIEPVRVYMRVPGTQPMPQLVRLVQDIEAAGFDGVGILDSQLLSRDTFVVLAQAATSTSRLTLFPAVTNPLTRHASVLAGAIQSVEELAPGRLTFAARRPIPLIMAASGPKAIELAGEIADGVLLLVGFNGGIVQRALEHLERGAKRAGRRVEDLAVIWAARTATAATTAGARRLARPTAVHWGVLRWGGYWLEPAGIRLPKLEIPEAVHTIYPDLSHARDWEAAIDATSFVSDEVVAQLCDALGLIGAPEDCAGRIAEMAKLGVRNLYLMPTLTFGPPEREIAAFRDVVFPRLLEAGLK